MNALRYIPLVLLLASLSCGPRIPSANLDYTRYQAIAVLPFETEGFLERYGSEIADQVIVEILRRDPSFPIVERAHVDHVLKEREMWNEISATPHPTDLIPADIIITGSVALAIENVERPAPMRQAHLTTTVRAIETDSGRIVWAFRFSATAEDFLFLEPDGIYHRYDSDAELREAAFERLARQVAKSLLGGRHTRD